MKLSELMRFQAKTIVENNCTTMSAEESETIADRLAQCERLEEETGFSLEDIGAMFGRVKSNVYKRVVARDIMHIIEQISRGEEYREYRWRYGSKGAIDLILSTIEDKYLTSEEG